MSFSCLNICIPTSLLKAERNKTQWIIKKMSNPCFNSIITFVTTVMQMQGIWFVIMQSHSISQGQKWPASGKVWGGQEVSACSYVPVPD